MKKFNMVKYANKLLAGPIETIELRDKITLDNIQFLADEGARLRREGFFPRYSGGSHDGAADYYGQGDLRNNGD